MSPSPAPAILNDKRAASLKPGKARKEEPDRKMPGLRLRVSKGHDGSIRRVWTLKYRFAGKEWRMTLGAYSDRFGVKAARKRAQELLGDVAEGINPAQVRDEAREQARRDAEDASRVAVEDDRTVGKMIDEYLRSQERRGIRTVYTIRRGLESAVRPVWGDHKASSITKTEILELVEAKADTAPVQANRLLAYLQGAFQWAVDHEWFDANPAYGVKRPTEEHEGERVLKADELALILGTMRGDLRMPTVGDEEGALVAPFDRVMCDALLVMVYTAQRPGEVSKMKWDQLDLNAGRWVLPGTLTKNKQQHVVTLSQTVRDIIGRQKRDGEYVFTRRRGAHIYARVKKAAAQLSRAIDAYLVAEATRRREELPEDREAFQFELRDLRRTGATRMGESGVAPHIVAHVLNHRSVTQNVTSKHYMKYAFENEKRAALDLLARQYDTLGQPADNVVEFRRRG